MQIPGILFAFLAALQGQQEPERLRLYLSTTDEELAEKLKGLSNLERLYLCSTKVTDAGVQVLQKALPNCVIAR